jgi:site-specific DNA recombinase
VSRPHPRPRPRKKSEPSATVRCAIYTRKSTEEGLEQEFNSLDAQRESAEAFIASQKESGWVALPDCYDDGGFSGGNMERPALDRLLRDISSGGIDCVVVYKVDRLSRSLMDFSRIMETFDGHGVSFVSVTQQFNTTHSMGRLTLNILLSFAQFEREIIGERIRDKLAAQRRKGKWAGGVPVLGYDVDRTHGSPKLVVNTAEAGRVREIFDLYLDAGGLLPVVEELDRRGWTNKLRTTKKGKQVGGRAFDKASLHALLTNPVVTGKAVHKGEVFEGEHDAIVDPEVFDRVQQQLKRHGRTGGRDTRNRYGAVLKGLLRCKSCGAAMTHTFTGKGNGRMYRYYRCTHAIKNGREKCSVGTLPAPDIERVVIDEVRGLGRDKGLLAEVIAEASAAVEADTAALRDERDCLQDAVKAHHAELRRLAARGTSSPAATARIAELNDQIADAERRLPQIEATIADLTQKAVTRDEAEAAFADFDGLWDSLAPREQNRLLRLLISAVEYDGDAGTVSVDFRPTSLRHLINHATEKAA